MTLTGHDLNQRFSAEGFDPSTYDTFQDLLDDIGISNPGSYMFMGKRFPNDPAPIHLIPESSMKTINQTGQNWLNQESLLTGLRRTKNITRKH